MKLPLPSMTPAVPALTGRGRAARLWRLGCGELLAKVLRDGLLPSPWKTQQWDWSCSASAGPTRSTQRRQQVNPSGGPAALSSGRVCPPARHRGSEL